MKVEHHDNQKTLNYYDLEDLVPFSSVPDMATQLELPLPQVQEEQNTEVITFSDNGQTAAEDRAFEAARMLGL